MKLFMSFGVEYYLSKIFKRLLFEQRVLLFDREIFANEFYLALFERVNDFSVNYFIRWLTNILFLNYFALYCQLFCFLFGYVF